MNRSERVDQFAGSLHGEWLLLQRDMNIGDHPGRRLYNAVDALYNAPKRLYHNAEHIGQVFRSLRQLEPTPTLASRWAVMLHDVVYMVSAPNNEEASAELCKAWGVGLGMPEPYVTEAASAIADTKHRSEPHSDNGALVCDADLSILAAEPAAYEAYVRKIRSEWAHVSDSAFAEGRTAFVRSMLARDTIYWTKAGIDRYETIARSNLEKELVSLTSD